MKIIPDKAKVWLATKGIGSGITTWERSHYEPKNYKRNPTKLDKKWCKFILKCIQKGHCEVFWERIPDENINIIKTRVSILSDFSMSFIIDDSVLHANCEIESLVIVYGKKKGMRYTFSSPVIACDVCDTIRFHTKFDKYREEMMATGHAWLF